MSRLLAIDYGTKKIGIAISDPLKIIAKPLCTIENKSMKSSIEKIVEICKNQSVEKIVLGLPLNMDGEETIKSREVRNFSRELSLITGITIEFWDERYTTAEANDFLIEKGINWKNSKEVVDQIAAAVILKSYLGGGL